MERTEAPEAVRKTVKTYRRIYAFPLGSILCMEDYRALPEFEKQNFADPYYLAFASVLAFVTAFLDRMGAAESEKAAIVFSDQVEFKNNALEFYEGAYSQNADIRRRTQSPVFRDMREQVALQAADLVAYEMYKEHERQRYRPNGKVRHGYEALTKISGRLGLEPMFVAHSKADLLEFIAETQTARRKRAYWGKRKGAKE